MLTSMYVIGSTIVSLCEYRENSFLLATKDEQQMLVTKDWQVVYTVKLEDNYNVTQNQVFPNFDENDFPFFVAVSRFSYDIINVKTGYREALIVGSALNDHR